MNPADRNTILITIGIPFYNAEKYLDLAIISVINQSFKDWILLLINDGSTDNSISIAKSYTQVDHRIRLIDDGLNKGLPTRLNELIDKCNTPYYARMDADDIMHPERIEKQINYLRSHPETDLVGCGLISIDNDSNIIGERKSYSGLSYSFIDAIQRTWAVHPTICGHTIWFKNNPYNENLKRAQDYELWIRTIDHSNFHMLSAQLLYYREASTSSWIKYYHSTRFSLMIFTWYFKRIGLGVYLKLSFTKIFKLFIYSFLELFDKSNYLIVKRSQPLSREKFNEFNRILSRLKSNHRTVLKPKNAYHE